MASLVPNQGSNLFPLNWKCRVLTTGLPERSLSPFVFGVDFFCCCWQNNVSAFYFNIIYLFLQINLSIQRRQWRPTPVLLPGKSHGWRSLVGCSPWGLYESDTTQRLHFHIFLSCIGEGNGNPLQYSCLENPRDGGPCWAAVYGVAQSRTQLKRLSSNLSILIGG